MEQEVTLYAQWLEWEKRFNYIVFSFDASASGYTPVERKTITFAEPCERELTKALVAQLQAAKVAVEAKAFADKKALDEKIQELLCLPAPAPIDDYAEACDINGHFI